MIGVDAAGARRDHRMQLDQLKGQLDELKDAKRNEKIFQKAHGFIPDDEDE